MSTNLKALIDKLNDTTRRALESAAGLCVARTHYDIEIEHYLLKALDGSDNDIVAILKHFGVDRSRLTKELERSLDSLKSGNARSPAFSPTVVKMLSEAWTVASIDFNAGNIRTGRGGIGDNLNVGIAGGGAAERITDHHMILSGVTCRVRTRQDFSNHQGGIGDILRIFLRAVRIECRGQRRRARVPLIGVGET